MDITIKVLEEYRADCEKLRTFEKELEWLYYPVSSPNGREMLGGPSSPSDPTAQAYQKIQKQKEKIEEQRWELSNRLAEVNEWLISLSDSELISIVRFHYMEGLTWRETAKAVYGYYDRQVCRKRVMRYFGKEK